MRRNIFPYRDGSRNWLGFRRTRYADPLVIARGLDRHPKFLADEHLTAILKYRDGTRPTETKQARAGMHEAIEVSAGAVRDVFGIRSLEKGGLADMECVDLLVGFAGYLNGLKKKRPTSLTPQPSTDATSNESGESTTPSTSDSSCSSTASHGGESTNSVAGTESGDST